MTQVVSEGIQIEAESHGNGDAPALVLIRGLGTQLVQWPASLLEGLVAEGLRRTAEGQTQPDLPAT